MVVGVLASYMTGDIVIQHHTIIQTSHTFSMYGGGDIHPLHAPQSTVKWAKMWNWVGQSVGESMTFLLRSKTCLCHVSRCVFKQTN